MECNVLRDLFLEIPLCDVLDRARRSNLKLTGVGKKSSLTEQMIIPHRRSWL